MMSRSELIEKYFVDGFTYEEIIKMLYCRHSIAISLRTLHRTLRTKGFYCRGFPSPLADVITFIENEISEVVVVLVTGQCTKDIYDKAIKSAKLMYE